MIVLPRPGGDVHDVINGDGRLVHRYRRLPDGREITIIDNRSYWRPGRTEAITAVAVALDVGALVLSIPRERHVVDYDRANDDDLYEILAAPPVEDLPRRHALAEVLLSRDLRDRMRRVDLDGVTFEFGAWDVSREQLPRLGRIASAINRVIAHDPTEVFVIEGHTDAVGDDDDNLTLSDRRAETVAQVLTEVFNIPIENLTTQGYGEQPLKDDTLVASRIDRRVAVRRITPPLARRG